MPNKNDPARVARRLIAALSMWGFVMQTAVFAQETVEIVEPESGTMAAVESAYAAGEFTTAREGLQHLVADPAHPVDGIARYRLARMMLDGRGGPVEGSGAIELLKQAIDAGHAGAMTLMAQLALGGAITGSDPNMAVDLLTRAARADDVPAQVLLGRLYQTGNGVAPDAASAVRLFERAAQAGSATAQFELSKHLSRGWGVEKDIRAAMQLLQMASNSGLAEAQFFLALNFSNGTAMPRDIAKSLIWLTRAAEGGHAMAQRVLGTRYLNGEDVGQDTDQAIMWLTRAANAGEPGAQSTLGYIYASGKGVPQDYEQAFGWYQKASARGLLRATTALAHFYERGYGVSADFETAVSLYREAADQGERAAQSRVAQLIVADRIALPPDQARATIWVARLALEDRNTPVESWLSRRAEQQDATAQARLGHILASTATESEVERLADGVALLKTAAERGNAFAQYQLAQLFGSGTGVPQDYVEAHKWANLAAARGQSDAANARELFSQLMTPDQVAEAQKRARNYVASN